MSTFTMSKRPRRSTRSCRASTAARRAATWPGRRTARASSTRATRAARSGRPTDLDFFQQVYFHGLGTPTEKDRLRLGKDLPRIAEIKLEADDATGRVLATVQNGDGGQFAFFLRDADGKWRQFSTFDDKLVQAAFGRHDDLFVISLQDAPRGKLLRLSR